jgi:hypothetical protein
MRNAAPLVADERGQAGKVIETHKHAGDFKEP